MKLFQQTIPFLSILFLGLLVSCENEDEYYDVNDSIDQFSKFYKSNDLDEALAEINKIISYYDENNNQEKELHFTIRKVELLRKLIDYETALNILDSKQNIIDSLGVTENTAYFYNRKAAILYEDHNFQGSLDAVTKAKTIEAKLGNKSWRYSSNLSIEGAIYRDIREFNKAQEILKEALKYSIETKNEHEYFIALYNLISSYENNNQWDSILKYGNEFIVQTPKDYNKSFYHETLRKIGEAHYRTGEKDQAYKFADSAYHIAYEHLADITDDRLEALRANDILEKEQLRIEVLETENKSKALLNYLLISVIVGSSIIFLLIFGEKRQYKKLSQSKEVINLKLKDSLEFNNKLISIVAHDIRGPLANITSMINLYKAGEIDEKMMDNVLHQLEIGTDKTNQLLENLLRWIKSQDSEFSPNYSQVDLSSIINEIKSELQTQITNKNLNVIDNTIDFNLKTDKDFISIIIRNLLSNAIKFSQMGDQIIIKADKKPNENIIMIQDFGVGMSKEQQEKISSGKSFSEWGTQSEKGTGLGLKLVRELVKTLGGSLIFKSEVKKGTMAIINLPNENSN